MSTLRLVHRKVKRAVQRRAGRIQARNDLLGRHMLQIESAREHIRTMVLSGEPYCVTRFGTTELSALEHCLLVRERSLVPIPSRIAANMTTLSGYFPSDRESIYRFVHEYQEIAPSFDTVGFRSHPKNAMVFSQEALVYHELCSNATPVVIESLTDPFLGSGRWVSALQGRSVLVIHPFTDSIQESYADDFDVLHDALGLPRFQLKTYAPVQTAARSSQRLLYADWFEALEVMVSEISSIEFDVALIGAGAYGAFLAAHIKTLGKTAIHIGGALQLYFGIAGKRWDDPTSIDYTPALSKQQTTGNQWRRPREHERPEGFEAIEGGCYW